MDVFPPHTRGSTCGPVEPNHRASVSPAYAGIDPRPGRRARGSGGFPRIRGDRPDAGMTMATKKPFPPHTRGSTRSPTSRRSSPEVSPAYAGIDRDHGASPWSRVGFPRIRGDRPGPWCITMVPRRFPPHTRGSTPRWGASRSRNSVSPAYAGIDLRRAFDLGRLRGFPRIRGDRPYLPLSVEFHDAFPPHTRGSTFLATEKQREIDVSPAYAGIDRGDAACARAVSGFPRIRGDRPRIYLDAHLWH